MKKVGRPTKYKPEYCEEIIEFFDIEPTYEKKLEHYDKNGSVKWVDYKLMPNKLPTLLGFAMKIGVADRGIFEDWAKKFPEFNLAFTRAKELQKEWLINAGMSGAFNPMFTIFVAKNITDMRDKTETDITTGGEKLGGFIMIPGKEKN